MATGGVSSGARVYLDFLRHYGVTEKDLSELKEKIHQANDLHIDGYGRVEFRNLTRFAAQLGIELPEAKLAQALSPSDKAATKISPVEGDFRSVSISVGETRVHAERSGPVQLDAKSLGSLSGPLQTFLDILHKHKTLPNAVDLKAGGIDSNTLAELLEKHRPLARQHLTSAQLESAKTLAYSATGPAFIERDARLSLHSVFRPLPTKSTNAELELFAKSGYESFFLRREEGGKSFSLHGFKKQSIVISLPKGAKAVLVDAEGNQRGLRLPTQKQNINGSSLDVLEISPEHVRASDKLPAKLDFTLRIIDKDGKALAEQHLAFDPQVGQRSEKLYTAKFAYPTKPSLAGGELADEHFARFVPSASKNPIPVGQRPEFHLDGVGTFDRLLLERDGKSFPIAEWVQFATPPKAQQQALKAAGGTRLLLDYRGASESHLDHPGYDPKAGFSLRDSFGHAATFNRELDQTNQAYWDHRGLRVITPKATLVADPLTPS